MFRASNVKAYRKAIQQTGTSYHIPLAGKQQVFHILDPITEHLEDDLILKYIFMYKKTNQGIAFLPPTPESSNSRYQSHSHVVFWHDMQ